MPKINNNYTDNIITTHFTNISFTVHTSDIEIILDELNDNVSFHRSRMCELVTQITKAKTTQDVNTLYCIYKHETEVYEAMDNLHAGIMDSIITGLEGMGIVDTYTQED